MMHDKDKHEYAELVTALVDNEINDSQLQAKIRTLSESDSDLKFEYHIQTTIKKTVKNKCRFHTCPSSLRNRIMLDIRTGKFPEESPASSKPVFSLRPWAYAAAVAVIFLTLFIFRVIDGEIDPKLEVLESKFSLDKMAMNNFKAILDSKLSCEIASSDSNTIKSFFHTKGLRYAVRMVCPKGWQYVGAVVSQDNGEKFGHVVLKDSRGNLLYIFEVDQKYLTSEKKLNLDNKIMSTIMAGSCYTQDAESMGIVINKCGSNVRAVVSKENSEKLKSLFCGLE